MQGNLQKLRLSQVTRLTIVHVHLLASIVRQRRLEEYLDFATLSVDKSIGLVQLDTLFEEGVNFGTPWFLSELFIEREPRVLGGRSILEAFNVVAEFGVVILA